MSPYRPISAFATVVLVACAMFFLLYPVFVVPRYAVMFADFGGSLPLATRIAMKPATAIVALFFLVAGGAGGALRPRERALILSLTAGGGLTLAVAFVLALYLPVFTLAEQLK